MRYWIFLLLMGLTSPAWGQGDWSIFQVEESEGAPVCHLPSLYFEAGSLELSPEAEVDLGFLAHELHQHPRMKLRLVTAVPGESEQDDKLAQRRLAVLSRLLLLDYDIDPSRVVAIYQSDQNSRSARKKVESALLKRQILCQCLWE